MKERTNYKNNSINTLNKENSNRGVRVKNIQVEVASPLETALPRNTYGSLDLKHSRKRKLKGGVNKMALITIEESQIPFNRELLRQVCWKCIRDCPEFPDAQTFIEESVRKRLETEMK